MIDLCAPQKKDRHLFDRLTPAVVGDAEWKWDGNHFVLTVSGQQLMNSTDHEFDTHVPMLRALADREYVLHPPEEQGRYLEAYNPGRASLCMLGLGIGLGAWMASRRGWTDITIIESNPHVIELGQQLFTHMPHLTIIHADANDYEPDRAFDVVWHDIPVRGARINGGTYETKLDGLPGRLDEARRHWSRFCKTFLIWDEAKRLRGWEARHGRVG